MHTAIIVKTSQSRARPVTPLDMIKKDAHALIVTSMTCMSLLSIFFSGIDEGKVVKVSEPAIVSDNRGDNSLSHVLT